MNSLALAIPSESEEDIIRKFLTKRAGMIVPVQIEQESMESEESDESEDSDTEDHDLELEAPNDSPADSSTIISDMDTSQSSTNTPEGLDSASNNTTNMLKEQKSFQVDINEEKDPWGVPESQWTTVKLNFVDPFACVIKSYKCQCCRLVVGHQRAIKAPGAEEHDCEICGKSFCTRQKLCRHKLRHREKKIACEYCPKKFHTKAECRNHSVRHLPPPRPFKCNLCTRDFWTAASFFLHIRNCHVSGMTCTTCIRVSVIQYTAFHYKHGES